MDQHDPTTEQETLVNEVRKDPRGPMPPKLAALRFKLGQKAKQQPEFRFYALYGHLLRVDVLETAIASVAASKGCETVLQRASRTASSIASRMPRASASPVPARS